MRWGAIWLWVALVIAASGASAQSPAKPKVKIVAVVDGPSPTFDEWLRVLRQATFEQLSERYEVDFPAKAFEADWSREGARRALERAYADSSVDAVFGLGAEVVQAVAGLDTIPKPTQLPFVMEAERLGLPRRGDVSGKTNLAYITERFDISDDVKKLNEVAGSTRVSLLLDAEADDMVALETQRQIGPARLSLVSSSAASASEILDAVPASADGVVLGPLRRLDQQERRQLLDGLIARRLPSVAMSGPSWVEQGALMTLRSETQVTRRAQRAALNVDLVLGGRKASELHVDFESREELLINVGTARAIGLRLSFDILMDAEIIEESLSPGGEGRLTMQQVMEEARVKNLALQSEAKLVEAGEEQVKQERGPLLPQGQLGAGLVVRDPDRIFQFSQIAERQANWSARASQSLYSESAWTNFKASRYRQSAREFGYRSEELNAMFEAGAAYIDILRTSALERIQRKNIRRTREYLDLARVRMNVGIANASEVYRWEITLAENQNAVVDARTRVGQAKIELNRVLNRGSEQPVNPVDLPKDDAGHPEQPDDPIGAYLADPWSFRQVRDFMVEEGLQNSPEARELEQRRRAQERVREGRARQLWLPDSFVEGGVVHDFWRDGKGSEGSPALGIPSPDEFGWDVGLYLSLPLSTGGSQVAAMRQAARLQERLDVELARIEQNIDTGVREELYTASAARAAVILKRRAAEAANHNLELVTDLYRQGTVDIITLVDAQTQSLVADLGAAEAVYNYLLALLLVDRASGHFRSLDTPEEKAEFAERLNAFMLSRQAQPEAAPMP